MANFFKTPDGEELINIDFVIRICTVEQEGTYWIEFYTADKKRIDVEFENIKARDNAFNNMYTYGN